MSPPESATDRPPATSLPITDEQMLHIHRLQKKGNTATVEKIAITLGYVTRNEVRRSLMARGISGFFQAFPNSHQFVIALFTACNFFLVLFFNTRPDPDPVLEQRMPTYIDIEIVRFKDLRELTYPKYQISHDNKITAFRILDMPEMRPTEDQSEQLLSQLVMLVTNRDNATGPACLSPGYSPLRGESWLN